MDWPLKKRLFYAGLDQHWQAQREQATRGNAGDGDLDGLMAEANAQAQAAGQTAPSGGHAGGQATPSHLPNDLDPSSVPTPDNVTNPYADAGSGTAAGSGSNGSASAPEVDGKRITRRDDATDPEQEQRELFDPSEIHPAVRQHGNVVRVQSDPDDHAVKTDEDGEVVTDADGNPIPDT